MNEKEIKHKLYIYTEFDEFMRGMLENKLQVDVCVLCNIKYLMTLYHKWYYFQRDTVENCCVTKKIENH